MKSLILALALSFSISPAFADHTPRHAGQMVKQNPTQQTMQLKAPGGGSGPARRVSNGGCCAKVNNQCVTICNKPGGCTGVGDCITNPN
jgi:hypothetical protein